MADKKGEVSDAELKDMRNFIVDYGGVGVNTVAELTPKQLKRAYKSVKDRIEAESVSPDKTNSSSKKDRRTGSLFRKGKRFLGGFAKEKASGGSVKGRPAKNSAEKSNN